MFAESGFGEHHDREVTVQNAILCTLEKQDDLKDDEYFEAWFECIHFNACHTIHRTIDTH